MPRKNNPGTEFRYYKMPQDGPILALFGQKWTQIYEQDADCLHFHNFLEIGYCYAGEGTLTLGERDYHFTGGEFSIIPPNYPHMISSDSGIISKWAYLFVDTKGILEKLYQKGDEDRQVKELLYKIHSRAIFCAVEEAPKIAGMVREILDIMQDAKEFYMEEAQGAMTVLLVNIARENQGGNRMTEMRGKATIPVSRALDYIALHYMEALKISDLAELCHVSETHFRRIFSAYMNMGPLEYINLIRVQSACAYLRNTDEAMGDIAGKCGFKTLSTFNRNFRQITGVSPSEWRKRPENFEQQILKYWLHSEEKWQNVNEASEIQEE